MLKDRAAPGLSDAGARPADGMGAYLEPRCRPAGRPEKSAPTCDRCQQPLRANHAILGAAGTHRVVTSGTTSGTRFNGGVHADGGVSASRLAAQGSATRSDPV